MRRSTAVSTPLPQAEPLPKRAEGGTLSARAGGCAESLPKRAEGPRRANHQPPAPDEALPETAQDIRAYLESLHRLRLRVQALREREAFFFRLAASTAFEEACPDDRVGENVSLAVDHARALRRQAEALIRREQAAERWIARLPNSRHRDVLSLRYLNGWHYDRVARALDLSAGRTHALQREALRLLPEYRAEEAEATPTRAMK